MNSSPSSKDVCYLTTTAGQNAKSVPKNGSFFVHTALNAVYLIVQAIVAAVVFKVVGGAAEFLKSKDSNEKVSIRKK